METDRTELITACIVTAVIVGVLGGVFGYRLGEDKGYTSGAQAEALSARQTCLGATILDPTTGSSDDVVGEERLLLHQEEDGNDPRLGQLAFVVDGWLTAHSREFVADEKRGCAVADSTVALPDGP